MRPTIKNYSTGTAAKVLKAEFEEIRNQNNQPVHCLIILANDNGAPVVEIAQPFQDDGNGNLVRQDVRIDVRSKEVTELRNQLARELKEIAYLKAELASAKAHIAYITAPPAPLDYSDLVNIAMIQSEGEICGWQNVSLSDSNFYATHKARAETDPQYLAILNSCRSHRRADRDADEMRARAEKLMDEMKAVMTLDEEIALGLYDARTDNDALADAAAAEWEARVARGEVEADAAAARHEEERGSAF